VCVCVCVCERERDRENREIERVCVCVCVCEGDEEMELDAVLAVGWGEFASRRRRMGGVRLNSAGPAGPGFHRQW